MSSRFLPLVVQAFNDASFTLLLPNMFVRAGFTFTQVELDYLLISVHYVSRRPRKARVQIHVGVFYIV